MYRIGYPPLLVENPAYNGGYMELKQLQDLADEVGFKYHYKAGVTTLANQLDEFLKEKGDSLSNHIDMEKEQEEKLANLTFADFDKKEAEENAKKADENLREANRLVRVQITCNNKNKNSLNGEIFTVCNSKLSTIKKYIPYGVPTHIPLIMLNMIKEKEYQSFRKERVNGFMVTKPHMIPEYNIQELPPLTSEELEAIKKKQLAEGFNGE